jgi:hypothetical protein
MDAIRVARVDGVTLERTLPPSPDDPAARPSPQRLSGTLHLTPHHLIFSPMPSSASSSASKEIWIAYPSITLLQRLPQSISGLYPLQVYTRMFESYVLLFPSDRERGAEDVWQSVKDCAVTCECLSPSPSPPPGLLSVKSLVEEAAADSPRQRPSSSCMLSSTPFHRSHRSSPHRTPNPRQAPSRPPVASLPPFTYLPNSHQC